MTFSSLPQLANIVLPAFIVITTGFFFAKAKKIDLASINNLVIYITTPCLVVSSLSDFTMDIPVAAKLFLSVSLVIIVSVALGAVLLRTLSLDSKVYLPTMVFANTGNLGLPLCLFAFGQYGFNIAILCVVTTTILHYTVGIFIVGPDKDFREIFRLPLIYASVGGIIISATGYEMPIIIERPISLLGQITIPAMLFGLGYRLSGMRISKLWLSFLFGSIKVFMGGALGMLFVNAFGMDGIAAKVVILECSMPPAVFNFVLAEKYGRNSEAVASTIVAGTVVSLITLPFLISYLLG